MKRRAESTKNYRKDDGVKFHPTTLSSFVHTSLDYVANVELFWNCSKYTMERRKKEKLIKDRTPIWRDFELSSLNDSQGPETSIYSVKGHLNSKWFHLQSSIRQKKWPFSFVLSSTTEVFKPTQNIMVSLASYMDFFII